MISFSLQKNLHTADGNMQLTIDCAIEKGQFVSLYGPSGAGKTSVLRMLAGFLQPENGYIKTDDELWYSYDERINIRPQQRKIGFVFQDYALFPNMNVKENIAFALAKGESKKIVDELLELTGLTMLGNKKIQTLSGGQQQRVALARAIAKKPQLLLLDEPLSAIDNVMREQLQETLLNVHERYELTTIIVSHDVDEIIKLCDKIIQLEHGIVQQYVTPSEFFFNGTYNPLDLTGSVLSVERDKTGDFVLILVSNRVLKIRPTEDNANNFKKGEKIQVVYIDDLPVIRKL
jgi:molybdate transport system ATP-binding protein